jgi:hypothetical protein
VVSPAALSSTNRRPFDSSHVDGEDGDDEDDSVWLWHDESYVPESSPLDSGQDFNAIHLSASVAAMAAAARATTR